MIARVDQRNVADAADPLFTSLDDKQKAIFIEGNGTPEPRARAGLGRRAAKAAARE